MIDERFYELKGPVAAEELAALAGLKVSQGDPKRRVLSLAAAGAAGPDDLTFLEDSRDAEAVAAGVCFAAGSVLARIPAGTTVIETPAPRGAYARAATRLVAPRELEAGQAPIHPRANIGEGCSLAPGCVIGRGAAVGRGTVIGANTVIGPGVQIGARSVIGNNVSIRCALIGDAVTILSGAVLGETGFGLAPGVGAAVLTPHFGRVIIQAGCSIGANSTVDRGLFDDTVLGEGVHIDNLSHVGHNTRIGAHTVMAAFAGISGSIEIGEGVMMGGRVGIADHVKIGDKARLGAGAAVMRDVPPGETHAGYPARPRAAWLRQLAWVARESQKRPGKDKE